jgi:hypothetical protein
MTEIKCPFKRKITGEVPDYYELQMQGQMAVCGLKECDYIECEMQVFDSFQDYQLMTQDMVVDHGVICEFNKNGETYYEYSDPYLTAAQADAWAREHSARLMKGDVALHLVKIHHWKLKQVFIKRIYFDEQRWNTTEPQIKAFWKDVIDMCETLRHAEDEEHVAVQQTIQDKKRYTFVKDSDED